MCLSILAEPFTCPCLHAVRMDLPYNIIIGSDFMLNQRNRWCKEFFFLICVLRFNQIKIVWASGQQLVSDILIQRFGHSPVVHPQIDSAFLTKCSGTLKIKVRGNR